MSPSIAVPDAIVKNVIGSKRELGLVIDEVAGARDVRSRQGAWGILSRDLLTRAMSFEAALIAAFAPFYNAALYTSIQRSTFRLFSQKEVSQELELLSSIMVDRFA